MINPAFAPPGAPSIAHPHQFDPVIIAIHWLTLLLVIAIFATAWARESADNAATAALLLTTHRSAGVILWTLTLFRLGWRACFGGSPALPIAMTRVHRIAARTNEYALYALLLIQPLTGFLQSIYRGKPFTLSGLTVPAIAARDHALTHFYHAIHAQTAWLLLALIAGHALAALTHHFLLGDGVLRSMMPFAGARSRKISAAQE
jgi:superoxide oxidase